MVHAQRKLTSSSNNVSSTVANRMQRNSGLALLAATMVAACAPPQPKPRTVFEFKEDGIAREGVLTRCNKDREATLADAECANARRASAAIALEAERAREAELERASEGKLLALREREALRAAAEQDAAAAALAGAEAAYEARWRNSGALPESERDPASPPATFGAPIGPVLPSMRESALFDVFAEGADPLGRRSLEIAAAEPPANELTIETPELAFTDIALVPRPFRDEP